MDRQRFERAQTALLHGEKIKAKSIFLESPTSAGVTHVLVAGTGPPVLMINGIGLPAAMWAPLMAYLGDFEVFAIDLPGFGLTDVDPAAYSDYRRHSIEFLTTTVQQLELVEAPAWITNSLGSRLAIWLATERPELVKTATFIACPALLLGSSAPFPMRLLSYPPVGKALTGLSPSTPKTVQRTAKMVHQYPLSANLEEMLVATERLDHYRDHFLKTLHLLLTVTGPRADMAIGPDELSALSQPVQLIWGRDDPFGDVDLGRRAAQLIPNCEFEVVAGGHAPWFSASNEIGPLVESFLKNHR
jgi:pimeloyl-ACP methyl ester carboxylesterase